MDDDEAEVPTKEDVDATVGSIEEALKASGDSLPLGVIAEVVRLVLRHTTSQGRLAREYVTLEEVHRKAMLETLVREAVAETVDPLAAAALRAMDSRERIDERLDQIVELLYRLLSDRRGATTHAHAAVSSSMPREPLATYTPAYLLVCGEDPVNLSGIIDYTGALQIIHPSGSLANYNQILHIGHEDLNESSGLVMVKIFDFSNSGASWRVRVAHGSTNWSRGDNYAYHEFGPMTNACEVDVTANTSGSSSRKKTRKIWMKFKAQDGL